MSRAARLLVLGCALLAAGCAGDADAVAGATGAARPAVLSHTADSPAALAREVLGAFERRDRERLRALALGDGEFRTQVWPGLPASRPGRNLPVDFVWRDLRQKSESSLTQLLARFGGERLELVGIAFEGHTTDHRAFTVRRDSVLTVRDMTGITRTVRAFGSMIEAGGRVKVFSFVVD